MFDSGAPCFLATNLSNTLIARGSISVSSAFLRGFNDQL